jgi:hypothetical protein
VFRTKGVIGKELNVTNPLSFEAAAPHIVVLGGAHPFQLRVVRSADQFLSFEVFRFPVGSVVAHGVLDAAL